MKKKSTELFERTNGPFTNRAHGSHCASKWNEKDYSAWMCLTFELFNQKLQPNTTPVCAFNIRIKSIFH